MDLLALVAFHEIVGHGGIGRASRATGQPKTTLSRRLRELEDALGVRLVERGPKTFRLTEEGAMLHRQTGGLLAEIEDVGQALAGGLSRPRGPLRVSVPGLFADLYMGRIAAGFVARYPEIALEVLSENRMIDPLIEGVDLVVRVNPHLDESLVGRIVMREETLLVAPPSLERPRRRAGDEASIGVPAILLPTTAGMPVWRVEGKNGIEAFTPVPVLRSSSVSMAWQAARNGAGAALLPGSLVDADLLSGRLLCWGRVPERRTEIWVLYTSRRLLSPKVSAFVEHLCAAFPHQRPPRSKGSEDPSAL
ncbi:LysR family transcriptional regulator [Polyangium fumosum]|uniref:LysR family transcriptional regulator n=1 Tax=Polyangium fumosum TaxID=889272 RepID=A0A4U1J8E3_9BACT|nr:LysR family transcriptional regulator [Polyangium fumosum]TKD03509.1 LysR family transcriptional regulator [Polyangium fumosum]